MITISSFVMRLKKLGIEIELISNYPWLYLDKINGKKVKERYEAEHGFTIFFQPMRSNEKAEITDITEIFKLIRKYVT